MIAAAVIIPAAGAGVRMGRTAKPFLQLRGEPLLVHALRPFLLRDDIVRAVIALPAAEATAPPRWLTRLDRRIAIVMGGPERADSVLLALDAVGEDVDIVLVHDAARPLVTSDIIQRTLSVAAAGTGAIAAVPASDTLHEVAADRRITATARRESLWHAQTPQAFPRTLLDQACRRAAEDGFRGTDEAAIVTHYGGHVVVVDGDRENLKVTVPADLILAESILAARDA